MNINLSAAAAKQHSKNNNRSQRNFEETNKQLSYGLNNRRGSYDDGFPSKAETGRKKKKSIFDSGDSDSDSHEIGNFVDANYDRQKVNRAIISEQQVNRKNKEPFISSQSNADSSIYDYDGTYESFSSGHNSKKNKLLANQNKITDRKESKYISKLLKTAKHRQYEREVILERKVVKDQLKEEEEMKGDEYSGKEKFVTKAYKRKLAEREAWVKEDEILEKKNESERQSLIPGFYGNFNRNVSMGNQVSPSSPSRQRLKQDKQNEDSTYSSKEIKNDKKIEFDEFAKPKHAASKYESLNMEKMNKNIPSISNQNEKELHTKYLTKKQGPIIYENTREESTRDQTIQKILEARVRYLKRKQ